MSPSRTLSNLNFVAGQTVPNLVLARVGQGNGVNFSINAGTADVIADVVGWVADASATTPGSRTEPITPNRVLDTRTGLGRPAPGPVGAGEAIEVQVLPANQGYTGVVMNLTGVSPTASTFVTAYPGNVASPPRASNLNLKPGDVRPNLVMVGVSPQGTVKLYNLTGRRRPRGRRGRPLQALERVRLVEHRSDRRHQHARAVGRHPSGQRRHRGRRHPPARPLRSQRLRAGRGERARRDHQRHRHPGIDRVVPHAVPEHRARSARRPRTSTSRRAATCPTWPWPPSAPTTASPSSTWPGRCTTCSTPPPSCSADQPSATSGSTKGSPRNSATGPLVTWPSTVLHPKASAGSARQASAGPRTATSLM